MRARKELQRHQALLQSYGTRIVRVPETGATIVLYPSCHTSMGDVGGVQKILQEVRFDQVCTELCHERLASLEEFRVELAKPNAFLKTDIKKVLQSLKAKHGAKHGGLFEGWELRAAVLEADRHKIPAIPVDRSVQVTLARFQASIPEPTVQYLLFPKVTSIMDVLRVARLQDEIPTDKLFELFSRSFQLPWDLRQKILRSTVRSDGFDAVPIDVVVSVVHEFNSVKRRLACLSPEDLKAEAQSNRNVPMPPGKEALLGPESLIDVFSRVISAERDVVIAHNLRTMTAPGATQFRGRRTSGPLVFAVVGAAHLDPVARYLQEPAEELSLKAMAALEEPLVPWHRRRLLSFTRLLMPFRMTLNVPVMQPFALPRRSSGELALA